MLLKQCISIIVSISLLCNQMLFAGSLDLDKTATQKTSLEIAPNGVPIVNITTPNAQGLSHNKFTNYNVDPKGLILNNANNVVQTQLAGFIASNPNLSSSTAKAILNEVTGTSRSLLNGYTEVAGDQADVIVANPNGISINGGGFINTPKVTLSTGKPELLNGQVGGFNVSGGDILIEGDGFNAAVNSQVDLYSKVLTLNAKLHAQSLNIVTGENHIASDGTITSKQASGTGVSLDSSALGGIYAQKITLVGTDKGVGVNLPPEVLASNGAINISSDGKITFQKATASESITVTSASSDIEINGAVSASTNIALHAKASIINNDAITAGLQKDGSANTASTLALQAASITNNKSLYANGSMSLDASSLVENKDTINTLETLQIKTDSLQNSGTMLSDKVLNIEAQNVDNKGFITATNSLLLTSTNFFINTGTIHSNNHLKFTLNGDFSNEGMINSGADATLLVNGAFINNNTLSTGVLADGSTNTASSLTIQALTLTNTAKISSLGDMYINASTLINKNYINASNILYTLSDTLNNNGTMYSNAYLILRLTQALNNEGTLNGGKSVDIISNGSLSNNNVISAGLQPNGSTNNTATLSLQASNITNTAKIFSHGNLAVTTPTLTNRGYFSAYNALQVNTTTLNNYGVLFSGTNMNLWVSDLLYNYENANILALGNLIMAKDASLAKTKRIVNEKATIETIEGDISLYAENFENKTDGLVKGTTLLDTKTLTLSNNDQVDGTLIASAAQKLLSEGKGKTLISVTAAYACAKSDADGCIETEIQYGGISEKQAVVTRSYNLEWDTVEVNDGSDYIQHHILPVYDIKYISGEDTAKELNIQLAKYGLSVSYGRTAFEQIFNLPTVFRYQISDLQGGEIARQVTVTSQQEYMISKNAPAKLLSGKKLSINADTITNYLSEISSNDDLKITGNTLNNGSEVLYQIDTRTGQYEYQSGGGGLFHHAHYSWAPLPATTTYTQTDAAYSLIYSAKNILGNLATINNIDIKSNQSPLGHSATTAVTAQTDSVSVAPITPVTIDPKTNEKKITLPKDTNGLFVTSTNPKSKYLVETNPAFASFSNFISSDYMLSRLGYNADATTKRLGDAFYENRLVRDSVFEQTGKRYLDPSITNDSDQFQYLMNNALSIKDDLKLTPNVILSNDQITALTKDIVWMETREVEGQQVLVPVVYIANAALAKTTDNGAKIVANGNVKLNVDTLTNQGDITAGGDVAITASKNIYNEGGAIGSGGNMSLQAGEGVYNISAELTAKALSINAATFQSDIASQDITRTYANSGFQNSQLLSNGSTINVQNDVSIKTANNLSLIGTTLNAGGDVTLASTDGDIAISSKTHTDTYDIRTRRGYNKGTSTQEIGSSINSNSLSMNANNLLINASDVTAQKDMILQANDVTITAGLNTIYTDSKYSSKGGGFFGGKKTQQDTKYKESVVQSNLNANNILIKADTGSATLEAANLVAKENIVVDAKKDINVLTKQYREGEMHSTTKSSWGGLSKSASMNRVDALNAKEAQLRTEALNIILKSGNDIKVIGSNIDAASDLQLQAANEVLIAAAQEFSQNEQWSKKSSFNLGNLLTSLATLGLAKTGPVYESEFKKDDKTKVSAKSSNINSGNNIIIDSGSAKVVGSNVNAEKNIQATTSTGSIEVLSAEESEKTSHQYKKTEVSLGNIFEMAESIQKVVTPQPGKDQDTKIKISVAKATYDNTAQTTDSLTHKSSSVSSKGGDIVMDSKKDIMVDGSKLDAAKTVKLTTQKGDVTIKESIDTYSENSKDKHASAEVSITVQNEYVEIGSAIKAAAESAKQLKKVKEDYSKYKDEVSKLESTLSDIKARYKAKEAGIDFQDIGDLQDVIDNVKDTEKYYVAAIAAAAADLASKTVAIASQVATAAASSGTWGFSAGLALDLKGSQLVAENLQTKSLASSIYGNDILIHTNIAKETTTTISGSNVVAENDLSIQTHDLAVKSSTDTTSSKQDSKDLSGSLSMTMYGGGNGMGATLGYGEGHQNSDSTTNTNSELLAKNITIETSNDASFKGATVKADDTLNMKVGGDLSVESQRDSSSSNSKGFNVSVSASLGADKEYTSGSKAQQNVMNHTVGARSGSGLGSTGASFGASTGNSQSKQTVLTSLIGDKVNIDVENNTHIKGALIAAGNTNEQGQFKDNGNLNLKTDTLTFANSSNTQFSSSNSYNVGANIGFGTKTNPETKAEESTTKVNSSSLSLSNQMGYSASKTLATVGQGNLEVGDKENSDDLTRLNRDTSKVNKDLYAGSVGSSVTATLDHRLLTEDGRKQIAEDVKKASNALSAMGDAITKDEVGLKNFFEHQGVVDATYEVMKQFIQTEDGKYAKIWNDQANATPAQLQEATNAFSKVIAYQYNISLEEAKLIAVDSFIKGTTYNQPKSNTIVINANGNNNALDYAETGTHEGIHAGIHQGFISNREAPELNEAYARLMEGYGSQDFVFVYNNAGYGEIKTDNIPKSIERGDSAIIDRNTDWFIDKAINDPKNVDYSINKILVDLGSYNGKTTVGTAYFYIDGEQKPRVVRVTSGNGNLNPQQKDKGPTPAGEYTIDPSKSQNMSFIDRILGRNQGDNELSNKNLIKYQIPDWGDFRVLLEPATTTDTFGRTQMYLHGGNADGSAGCIDCGQTPNQWILKEIRDTTIQIPVEVKYGK